MTQLFLWSKHFLSLRKVIFQNCMAGLPTYGSTADSAFPDQIIQWLALLSGIKQTVPCYQHPQIRQRGLCRTRTGFPINSAHMPVHAEGNYPCTETNTATFSTSYHYLKMNASRISDLTYVSQIDILRRKQRLT